jgi:hypothetical protein
MDAHNAKLVAYLETLPDEEVHDIWLRVRQFARDLGVEVPGDKPQMARKVNRQILPLYCGEEKQSP